MPWPRLSSRLPRDVAPNAWARALAERRDAGVPLWDLTETNPTAVGLGGAGPDELAALADPGGLRYEPDPGGIASAREAVARYYAARGSGPLAPEDVVLTASTSEAYAHLLRLLAEPGAEWLVPMPSYPLVEPLAALEGVAVRPYRLEYDRQGGRWHVDFDSLERGLGPRTRAVVAVQPNNPTGSCLAPAELERLEALCEQGRIPLVADEVFADFPWPPPGDAGDAPAAPLPSLAGERRPLTFVLSGLSKVCGMPQLKLAWIALAGPGPARRVAQGGLEWIADLFLSVATPVQLALPRLLEARHAFQARARERLARNLAEIRALVARRPELELCRADGGWAAVLRVPAGRSEEEWALGLLRRGVVAHPGHFYDFPREAYLVVSLVVPPVVLARGLAELEALAAEG
jgi:hypothetical protein